MKDADFQNREVSKADEKRRVPGVPSTDSLLRISLRETWAGPEEEMLPPLDPSGPSATPDQVLAREETLPLSGPSGPSATPDQVLASRDPDQQTPVDKSRLPTWALASLLLHFFVFAAFLLIARFFPPPPAVPESLQVFNVDARDLPPDLVDPLSDPLLGSRPEVSLPEASPPKPVREPDPHLAGQIVNLAPPEKAVPPPENAQYLAADNHRAERETRSPVFQPNPKVVDDRAGDRFEEGDSSRSQNKAEQAAIPDQADRADSRDTPERSSETRVARLPNQNERSHTLSLPDDGLEGGELPPPKDEADAENEARESKDESRDSSLEASIDQPMERKIALFPTHAQMARLLRDQSDFLSGYRPGATGERSGRPDNDALDVPEGETTRLNARATPFFDFFNTIRTQFNFYYTQGSDNLSPRDIQEHLTRKNYITRFTFSILPNGQLGDVRIVESANVRAFDALVVQALRMASPFPAPPSELLGPDGRLTLGGECRLGVGLGAPRFGPRLGG